MSRVRDRSTFVEPLLTRASLRRLFAVTSTLTIVLAGCAQAATTTSPTPSQASPSAPAVTALPSSAAPTSSASPVALGTVQFALDWTPNTDHTGIYVAQAKGWYRDAGVDVQVLPYGTTTPEALMTAGQADCGISFQDSLTFAVAAGAPIVSVMAVLQHTASRSPSSTRPTSSARATSTARLRGVRLPERGADPQVGHQGRRRHGKFTVTLDTAAYEALYAKRADFVITFAAWKGIEAAQRGIKLRTFDFGDYGFPDFYQVVVACDSRWLAAKPDLARAFVAATVRGFELGADDPDAAAAILVAQNPEVFDGNPALPKASQEFLALGRVPAPPAGRRRLPDAHRVAGLLGVPVRQQAPDRRRWQAADLAAGLRGTVHERLPAVTDDRHRLARWGPPLVLIGLLVLAWEAYVRVAGLDPITLPPPSRVLTALWDAREAAVANLVPTLLEALVGCGAVGRPRHR